MSLSDPMTIELPSYVDLFTIQEIAVIDSKKHKKAVDKNKLKIIEKLTSGLRCPHCDSFDNTLLNVNESPKRVELTYKCGNDHRFEIWRSVNLSKMSKNLRIV